MPETIAAFAGRALRGPLNVPVPVSSFGGFRKHFGGDWSESALATAVRCFFDHGGRSLYVVRIANGGRGPMVCLPAEGSALILRGVNPGHTESIRAAVDCDRIHANNEHLFNLTVQRIDPTTGFVIDQEYYRAASYRQNSRRFIGDLLSRSALVRAEQPYPARRPETTAHAGPGSSAGYIAPCQRGSDGVPLSDYDLIGARDQSTGLFALDRCPHFDLLYLPPADPDRDFGPAVHVVAESYCRQRGAMLIVDPGRDCHTAQDMLQWMRGRAYRSANALTYFPGVRGRNASGETVRTAGAALAGILCRHDRRRGPWRELAADEGALNRAWCPDFDLDPLAADALVREGVNVITRGTAGRASLTGSVTMGRGSGVERCFHRLSVRRGCLRILDTIKRIGIGVSNEPDSAALAGRIERELVAYFRGLAAAGALANDRFVISCNRCDGPGASPSDPAVMIEAVFRPEGSPDTLSFTIRRREDGFRILSASSAPLPRNCA